MYNVRLIRFRLFSEGKPTKPNKEEQGIRKKEYKPTTAELYKVLAVVKYLNKMSKKYSYIGSSPKFQEGDKVRVKADNHFMIESYIESGKVKVGEVFTFKEWNSYGYGMNWFSIEEGSFTLSEFCCERA